MGKSTTSPLTRCLTRSPNSAPRAFPFHPPPSISRLVASFSPRIRPISCSHYKRVSALTRPSLTRLLRSPRPPRKDAPPIVNTHRSHRPSSPRIATRQALPWPHSDRKNALSHDHGRCELLEAFDSSCNLGACSASRLDRINMS